MGSVGDKREELHFLAPLLQCRFIPSLVVLSCQRREKKNAKSETNLKNVSVGTKA